MLLLKLVMFIFLLTDSTKSLFVLLRFLYEYSRRHPEYGALLLLRIAKVYEARLEKCCAEADPPACYGNVVGVLQEKKNVALC